MAGRYSVDLSDAVWTKSRRSSGEGNNCVEVARVGDVVAVRDSKAPEHAPLIFNRDEWHAFVHGVKNDEL